MTTSPAPAHAGHAARPADAAEAVARVAALLEQARSVTVLTGAGISTDSGIPDFRGPTGLWTLDPAAQRLFDLDAYRTDPEVRRRAWRARLAHPAWSAVPNAGHAAIVDLERSGRLHTLLTQNIDGLHQRAGNDPARVVELHGTIHEVECLDCDRRGPTTEALARVAAGEQDPPCLVCGGLLKTATISFGQSLRPEVLARAVDAAREADLFVAVGTSLTVRPAAVLPALAAASGVPVVVVNAQPTPCDASAAHVLRSPIGGVLPLLVGGLAPA